MQCPEAGQATQRIGILPAHLEQGELGIRFDRPCLRALMQQTARGSNKPLIFIPVKFGQAGVGRGDLFGLERLDKVLENCTIGATDLLNSVIAAVEEFAAGVPAHDDRTLLVAKIS